MGRLNFLSGAIFEKGHFISYRKRKFQVRLSNPPAVSYGESRFAQRLKILSGAIFEMVPFRQFPRNAELTLLISQ